jgi:hypothetical protein
MILGCFLCRNDLLTVAASLREGRFFDLNGGGFREVGEICVLFGLVLDVMLDLIEFLSEIELILGIRILIFEMIGGLDRI